MKLTGVIGQEISDRKAADEKLNGKIDAEAVKRDAADLKLTGVIGQEMSDRKAADEKLNGKIDAEAVKRDAADLKLTGVIGQEISDRKAADAELSNRIHGVAKDVKKVGARAAALAGLHPLDYDETTKFSFAATGSYKSENSVALGAFYRPNKNVMVSAASTLGSDAAYNVGVSFKFGSETAKTEVSSFSTQQLYAAVAELQRQMAAQQKTIEEQQQEINALKNAQNA